MIGTLRGRADGRSCGRFISFVLALTLALSAFAPPSSAEPDKLLRSLDDLRGQLGVIEVTDELLARVQRFVEAHPDDPDGYYVLGRLLERRGFEELALEQYAGAIARQSGFLPAHHSRFVLLLKLGEKDDAFAELADCESLASQDGHELFRLGLVLESRGFNDDARRLYEKAAAARYRGFGVGTSLARLRVDQGRSEEALTVVEWDLKNDPKNAAANMVKSEALLALGRGDEAIAAMQLAYRSNPCDADAAARAADRLMRAGRNDEALEPALLSIVCDTGKESRLNASKRLVARIIKGMPADRALETVNSTGEQLGNSPYALFYRFAMGDVYDRLGRPYTAVEQYGAGFDLTERFAVLDGRMLSRGMFRLGLDMELCFRNYQEALALYKKASELDPRDEQIKKAYERLKSRLENRNNDIAWQLKDFLWRVWSSLLPGPQAPPKQS